MTQVTYDPEADAMMISPTRKILDESKYEESIDAYPIIVDIGDQNNIREVEILDVLNVFKITKDRVHELNSPDINYGYYTNTHNNHIHVLDVFFKGVGGVRIMWDDTKAWYTYMDKDRVFIAK
jgi:uncharacterized protein YuzE